MVGQVQVYCLLSMIRPELGEWLPLLLCDFALFIS